MQKTDTAREKEQFRPMFCFGKCFDRRGFALVDLCVGQKITFPLFWLAFGFWPEEKVIARANIHLSPEKYYYQTHFVAQI